MFSFSGKREGTQRSLAGVFTASGMVEVSGSNLDEAALLENNFLLCSNSVNIIPPRNQGTYVKENRDLLFCF